MAKGKTTTGTIIVNNKIAVTTTRTVEQIVVNEVLMPDPTELNPGVNSRTQ